MDDYTYETQAVPVVEQVTTPVDVEQVLTETEQVSTAPVVAPVALVVTPVDVSKTKAAFEAFVAAAEHDIHDVHAFEQYEVAALHSHLEAIKHVLDRK